MTDPTEDTMPDTRMRLVGWRVQPVVMADDGEHLTPVEVSGQMVPAAAWEDFKAGGDTQALAHVEQQLLEQAG